MQLAVEAGAKRILIPSENKRDVADVPDAILTAIQWQFYDSPSKSAIYGYGIILIKVRKIIHDEPNRKQKQRTKTFSLFIS
jgi:hypothetical protein